MIGFLYATKIVNSWLTFLLGGNIFFGRLRVAEAPYLSPAGVGTLGRQEYGAGGGGAEGLADEGIYGGGNRTLRFILRFMEKEKAGRCWPTFGKTLLMNVQSVNK